MEQHKLNLTKLFLIFICGLVLFRINIKNVQAYSAVSDRPVFLAWPLPSYIGVARISQFPNTPWTWNYLGLNAGQQCPPAFGYLSNAEFWSVWKDSTIAEEQDQAQADPHNFQMVNCYSTLGPAGENGHEGTDIKAPANMPAFASASGKVAGWRLDNVNSMIVLKHCLGGEWNTEYECIGGQEWYTTYMHINPNEKLFQIGLDVVEGDEVGKIYNQGDNSHLHFEVGLDQRSYLNYVNPWGRDSSPWYGCMWKDQSLCVQPNPGYKRVGIITQSDRLLIHDDNLNIVEVFQADKTKELQMAGQRIALVNQDGFLLARDIDFKRTLPFGHEFVMNWVNLGKDFVSYQITENRLAILGPDGIFRIKEGDLHNEWTSPANNIQSFSISKNRAGVLTQAGELMIKEGSLDNNWATIAVNVKAFQLLDSRIAVVDLQGNLFVQEGALSGEWKPMASNIRSFQISGTRIAIIDDNGNLLVNDGNLRAPWVLQATSIQQYQIAGNRIVILDKDGKWKIKEGDLYQSWKEIEGFNAKDVRLNGELPVSVQTVE